VADTVRQAVAPAPAPVSTTVNQALDTVTQACDLIGGCP
jgi:hypothetical protein